MPIYRPYSLTADSAFAEILINGESERIFGSFHVVESVEASIFDAVTGPAQANLARPLPWADLWPLPGLLLNGVNLGQPPEVAFLASKASV